MQTPILLILAMLFFNQSVWAQATENPFGFQSLIRLDLGAQGAGLGLEGDMGGRLVNDISIGFGGGYEVSEDGVSYLFGVSQPAFYAAITERVYLGRAARLKQEKGKGRNVGHFIGVRIKYAAPSLSSRSTVNHSMLTNLHWGIQRPLGNRWIFNGHAGIGYAFDLGSTFGGIYPSIGASFGYILRKW